MGHFEELCKKANKTPAEQRIIDNVMANRRGEKLEPEEADPEPTPEDEPEPEPIVEGKSKKGGVNERPTTPRPPPPIGQGGKQNRQRKQGKRKK